MIEDLQGKIAEYHALRPFQTPVVKKMSLNLAIDPIGTTDEWQEHLTLQFARDHREEGDELHLELLGVRELRFEQPTGCPFNLYLEITTMDDTYQTGVRFAVHNTEQDVKFVCSCFDFVAVIQYNGRV